MGRETFARSEVGREARYVVEILGKRNEPIRVLRATSSDAQLSNEVRAVRQRTRSKVGRVNKCEAENGQKIRPVVAKRVSVVRKIRVGRANQGNNNVSHGSIVTLH